MATAPDPRAVFAHLRKAVASDVKLARRDFRVLRGGPPEVLQEVLELASRPGEGRVRQMIAAAARIERFTSDIEPWLRRWLVVESDEFARSAIAAALQVEAPAGTEQPAADRLPPSFVEAYQFVSERLCHRVRNALTIPVASLVRLEQLAREVTDPGVGGELMAVVERLRPAVQRISQIIEFDTGDGYLTMQAVPVGDWLEAAVPGFKARFGYATLTLIGATTARRLRVWANPFLLDTAFGNLWANAVQAAPDPCHITVELNAVDGVLHVLVRDNGPGFTTQMVENAFRMPYSTKSEARGRGLLEIADAVRRLQGEVLLLPVATNQHRVQLRLPLITS